MKKIKIFLIAALTVLMLDSFSQGVGINNDESDADPSAILDVKSTTKGMLVPRMTVAQAAAISSPAEGLLVFATDVQSFLYYKSGTWNYLTSEFAREVADFDFDTKITTGNGLQTDDDLINIYCGNSTLESFIIDSMRIAPNMNSVFIGREAGGLFSDRENLAIGDSALSHNGEGAIFYEATGNTALGSKALYSNTMGFFNSATGNGALYSNTTGTSNSATGNGALYSNTTGTSNSATGYGALYSNTVGYDNSATGYRALYSNTTGSYNSATGSNALYYNTTGSANSATGSWALYSNTTGSANSATGYVALYANTTGFNNSATGSNALYYNTTGSANSATGYMALYNNNGSYNAAYGFKALYNGNGNGNCGIGYQALLGVSTGYNNSAIGSDSYPTGNFHNSTALGHAASITDHNMVKIGDNNVSWIGGHSAWQNTSDGRFKRNVKEDIPGLDFIQKLRPVSYTWDIKALDSYIGLPDSIGDASADDRSKAEQTVHTGFIAQEVEQAARESGYDFDGIHHPAGENDPYSLAYSQFVVPLVKAVQELADKNTYQQQMIEELRTEIEVLKEQVKK